MGFLKDKVVIITGDMFIIYTFYTSRFPFLIIGCIDCEHLYNNIVHKCNCMA